MIKSIMSISSVVMLMVLVLIVDLATGPEVQFPIAYVVPVLLASWYFSRNAGIVIAVILAVARLAIYPLWGVHLLTLVNGVNFMIRLSVLVGIALMAAHSASLTRYCLYA